MGCGEQDIGTWRSVMGCFEQDIGTWRSVTGCSEQDFGTWRSIMGCCEQDIGIWRSVMGCCQQDIGTWRSVMGCCEQDIETWRSVLGCSEQDFGTQRSVMGCCELDTAILVGHELQGMCCKLLSHYEFPRKVTLPLQLLTALCYPSKNKDICPFYIMNIRERRDCSTRQLYYFTFGKGIFFQLFSLHMAGEKKCMTLPL